MIRDFRYLSLVAHFVFGLISAVSIAPASAAPGDLDLAFNPDVTGGFKFVEAVAVQPDGKIVIGGNFTHVGGTARTNLARLHPDGTVDMTFDPGIGSNGTVKSLAIQNDGKILAGGSFSSFDGEARGGIVRLHADGSLESTATFDVGSGLSASAYCIALQPDGKILVGGNFNTFDGQAQPFLVRLEPDGTLESTLSFDTGTGPSSSVFSIVVQPNGQILIAGQFTSYNGIARNRIARQICGAGCLVPDPGYRPDPEFPVSATYTLDDLRAY